MLSDAGVQPYTGSEPPLEAERRMLVAFRRWWRSAEKGDNLVVERGGEDKFYPKTYKRVATDI